MEHTARLWNSCGLNDKYYIITKECNYKESRKTFFVNDRVECKLFVELYIWNQGDYNNK